MIEASSSASHWDMLKVGKTWFTRRKPQCDSTPISIHFIAASSCALSRHNDPTENHDHRHLYVSITPVAAATVAPGTSVPLSDSRCDRSARLPSRASSAVSASPTPSSGSCRAMAGASWREAARSYDRRGRSSTVGSIGNSKSIVAPAFPERNTRNALGAPQRQPAAAAAPAARQAASRTGKGERSCVPEPVKAKPCG
jgi:hypothetical protein